MLVLPNTDTLRVYLHQFGQRVHQSPTNRHRPTHGNILIGELVARCFRCRINRCPIFAHHIHGYARLGCIACLPQDVGRFATGSAVAHGDGVYFKTIGNLLKLRFGGLLVAAWRKRIHNIMIKQVALRIEAHHFAPRANAWVYTHHTFLTQWGGK